MSQHLSKNATITDAKSGIVYTFFDKTPHSLGFYQQVAKDLRDKKRPAPAGFKVTTKAFVETPEQAASQFAKGIREKIVAAAGKVIPGGRVAADLILPRSAPELLADIGTGLSGTGPRIVTKLGIKLTKFAERMTRAAVPATLAATGAAATGEPVGPAAVRGAALGAIPEVIGAGRGAIQKQFFGAKTLEKFDKPKVLDAIQDILPENVATKIGAPKGQLRNLSTSKLRDLFEAKNVTGSLSKTAGENFRSRMKEIEKVAGDLRLSVPSLGDDPVTIKEAFSAISKRGFKLVPGVKLSESAKIGLIERDNLIEEVFNALDRPITEGTERPSAFTPFRGVGAAAVEQDAGIKAAESIRPQIQQAYDIARKEFRRSQSVIRLFEPGVDEVISKETGRINLGNLQKRFLNLRAKPAGSGIDEETDQLFQQAFFRGAGTAQVDQPGQVIAGFFSRGAPLTAPPGAAVRGFKRSVFPGSEKLFGRPGVVGRGTAIAANRLLSSPFAGEVQ